MYQIKLNLKALKYVSRDTLYLNTFKKLFQEKIDL